MTLNGNAKLALMTASCAVVSIAVATAANHCSVFAAPRVRREIK